jgi:hypothetical protein
MSLEATCSRDENPAAATCTRCGDFLCLGCIHGVDGSPLRYCAECLERRSEALKGKKLGFNQRNKPARLAAVCAVLSICLYFIPWGFAGGALAIWGIAESRKYRGEGLVTALISLVLCLFTSLFFLASFPEILKIWTSVF